MPLWKSQPFCTDSLQPINTIGIRISIVKHWFSDRAWFYDFFFLPWWLTLAVLNKPCDCLVNPASPRWVCLLAWLESPQMANLGPCNLMVAQSLIVWREDVATVISTRTGCKGPFQHHRSLWTVMKPNGWQWNVTAGKSPVHQISGGYEMNPSGKKKTSEGHRCFKGFSSLPPSLSSTFLFSPAAFFFSPLPSKSPSWIFFNSCSPFGRIKAFFIPEKMATTGGEIWLLELSFVRSFVEKTTLVPRAKGGYKGPSREAHGS